VKFWHFIFSDSVAHGMRFSIVYLLSISGFLEI
jgi:hypothetical protein